MSSGKGHNPWLAKSRMFGETFSRACKLDGMIKLSLSDRACDAWFEFRIGYLATLVPVGSVLRA